MEYRVHSMGEQLDCGAKGITRRKIGQLLMFD